MARRRGFDRLLPSSREPLPELEMWNGASDEDMWERLDREEGGPWKIKDAPGDLNEKARRRLRYWLTG